MSQGIGAHRLQGPVLGANGEVGTTVYQISPGAARLILAARMAHIQAFSRPVLAHLTGFLSCSRRPQQLSSYGRLFSCGFWVSARLFSCEGENQSQVKPSRVIIPCAAYQRIQINGLDSSLLIHRSPEEIGSSREKKK